MDQPLLEHLFALADRTGDRLIIVDPASRRPFVLMGLAQYEDILARGSRSAPDVSLVPEPSSLEGIPVADGAIPLVRATTTHGDSVAAEGAGFERFDFGGGRPVSPGFTPEPVTAALPDDDRFYVEPLEG